MGYEVRLTAKARGDLNEIVAYIAQDNPLAAEKLGDELVAEADSLSSYPYRGGLIVSVLPTARFPATRYFRAAQALGVSSATRLNAKSAKPGSTEPR
jgi:plasmid stabilization system protein ParE